MQLCRVKVTGDEVGMMNFLSESAEDDGIRQLARTAEVVGWEEALFNYTRDRVVQGRMPLEDQRAVDWKYLLPSEGDSVVLCIGCGLGTVPTVLSETCARVYAVDTDWFKIAFLNIRKRQQGIDNLYLIYIGDGVDFPFPDKHFDIVVLGGGQWKAKQAIQVRGVIRLINNLLNERGSAYFSLGNLWAFQQVLRQKTNSTGLSLHTIFGYRRMLHASGFSQLSIFAPLPNHKGIPLFYIPFEEKQAWDYFFRFIFPLFEMASPEVKRSYGFEYAVAKAGVRLALQFKLVGVAKFFVPGFVIIARKGGQGMGAGYAR
ncbi:MAG: hypothetical protein CVU80_02640 [Elusimicrobia bacterium HGW-Elusimicrobia-4]|nr:MAG: hypothetical protein CVU80_02640 [Elusimicrobia bacterium HGW-Elusimicrobia-4]